MKTFNNTPVKRGDFVAVSALSGDFYSGTITGFRRGGSIRIKTRQGLKFLWPVNPAQSIEILFNTGETNFGIVKARYGRNTPQKLPKLKKKKEIVLESVGNNENKDTFFGEKNER